MANDSKTDHSQPKKDSSLLLQKEPQSAALLSGQPSFLNMLRTISTAFNLPVSGMECRGTSTHAVRQEGPSAFLYALQQSDEHVLLLPNVGAGQ